MPIPALAILAAKAAAVATAADMGAKKGEEISETWTDSSDWGGTAWLENQSEAHEKYLERLDRWSNAHGASDGAFKNWTSQDKSAAVSQARWAFTSTGGDPVGYWSQVRAFWEGDGKNLRSISPAQLAKIQEATGASVDAAQGYEDARAIKPRSPLPWWALPAGAVAAVLLIRR